jgi:hypothetical protein
MGLVVEGLRGIQVAERERERGMEKWMRERGVKDG